MNTTSSIQNMTTVEINNRIKEIDKVFDGTKDTLHTLHEEVKEKINDFLNGYVPGLQINLGHEYSRLFFTEDKFHSIEMQHEYELDYETEEKTWVFKLNVASCGSFSLLETTDEKEANVQRYYMTIATLMTNNELKNGLNTLLKEYADKRNEINDGLRDIRSEYHAIDRELNHRKEVEDCNKYTEMALLPENNRKYVIITKNHKFGIKNVTYHKEEVAVTCEPTSRENLKNYYLNNDSKIVKCSTLRKF
jgi:uncharacterized coiled-coil DUF342 family protein